MFVTLTKVLDETNTFLFFVKAVREFINIKISSNADTNAHVFWA